MQLLRKDAGMAMETITIPAGTLARFIWFDAADVVGRGQSMHHLLRKVLRDQTVSR